MVVDSRVTGSRTAGHCHISMIFKEAVSGCVANLERGQRKRQPLASAFRRQATQTELLQTHQ